MTRNELHSRSTPGLTLERSERLRERARRAIPGGAHTYAKGDDQFPLESPGFIERGEGCRVWDVDGNEYIEYGMGLRAVTLGHGFPEVARAAAEHGWRGTNFNRPSPLEVECAEALIDLVPAAEMVKFTKDGSSANTAAVKLARAHTGRDLIAICAEHPFFSYDDWFISTTDMNAGIPPDVPDRTVPFHYNDVESLQALFSRHGDSIACVILEAERTQPPTDGFLEQVQALCRETGTVFILDEMITGFRWHRSGAQEYYGLEPGISTFGKALANGFSVSALVGRREIMERGYSPTTSRHQVFLLSTTHGAETPGLAAALATMRIYAERDVVGKLWRQGERLRRGVDAAARERGLEELFRVVGKPCCLHYDTRGPDGAPSQQFRTLFLQELIARGVIAPSFVVSYSHEDADIDATVDAVAGALDVYALALEGGIDRYLRGRAVRPVYQREL